MLADDQTMLSQPAHARFAALDAIAPAHRVPRLVTSSAAEAIAWAPTLMRHGAGPGDVLRLMDLGHSGPESNHYQTLRAALEAQPAPTDPALETFRQTGIARFAELGREAGGREREERITGRIH